MDSEKLRPRPGSNTSTHNSSAPSQPPPPPAHNDTPSSPPQPLAKSHPMASDHGGPPEAPALPNGYPSSSSSDSAPADTRRDASTAGDMAAPRSNAKLSTRGTKSSGKTGGSDTSSDRPARDHTDSTGAFSPAGPSTDSTTTESESDSASAAETQAYRPSEEGSSSETGGVAEADVRHENFAIPSHFERSSDRIVDVTDSHEKPDISNAPSSSNMRQFEHLRKSDRDNDINHFSVSTGTSTSATDSDAESVQSEPSATAQPRRRRPLPPRLKELQKNMLSELGQIQVVLETRRSQILQQQQREKRERMNTQEGNNTPSLENSFLANRINTISQRLKTSSDTTEMVSPPGTPMA